MSPIIWRAILRHHVRKRENIKIKYGSAISPPTHHADQKIEVIGLAGNYA